jgi:hypothetical protein
MSLMQSTRPPPRGPTALPGGGGVQFENLWYSSNTEPRVITAECQPKHISPLGSQSLQPLILMQAIAIFIYMSIQG